MIRIPGFQFFNKSEEHIIDGESFFKGELSLTVYAGNEEESFTVSQEEVLELAQALLNLVEEARAGHDTTTGR